MQCLLAINIQRFLCTMIKFCVVKKAKEAVCALCKTLIAVDNHTARYRSNLQFIDS